MKLQPLILAAAFFCLAAHAQPRVLILRFEQIDQQPGLAWVGRAVQQSLATDLNRDKFASAELLPETRSVGTTDTTVATQLGREQQADFVVVGGYQTWDGGLRITAQVLKVSSGETVGSLKSTGQLQGLFLMQDALVGQLKQIIAPRGARKIDVPAETLVIRTSTPLGVTHIKPNVHETVSPPVWKQMVANRYVLLNKPGGYPCSWYGGHWGWWPYWGCW